MVPLNRTLTSPARVVIASKEAKREFTARAHRRATTRRLAFAMTEWAQPRTRWKTLISRTRPPVRSRSISISDNPSRSASTLAVSAPNRGADVAATPPPSASLNGVPTRSRSTPSASRPVTRIALAATCGCVIT